MKRRAIRVFLALTLAASSAAAGPARLDPQAAEAKAKQTLEDGDVGFCAHPPSELDFEARRYCPLAESIEHCEAFVTSCAPTPPPAAPPLRRT